MDQSRRLEVQTLLEQATGRPVYFQTPEGFKMDYPCTRYQVESGSPIFADNIKYLNHKRYKVVVMDRNPDSVLPDAIENLPYTSLIQSYAINGLNHWVYRLSY